MDKNITDIKPDIKGAADSNERPALMEPMLIGDGSPHRGALTDLAMEVVARSSGFRSKLPDGVRIALADLVRSMNCYYSNLIEGHDTHPVEIEKALRNDYSQEPKKRNLQLEAKAHIKVQEWIDNGGLRGRTFDVEGLKEIHRKFCAHLPEDLLWTDALYKGERLQVQPGEFRQHIVEVGRHVSISPGAVPRFMAHFETAYHNLGKTNAILCAAAAHHRFVWIHPFLDGNGRVARLMSHANMLETLDTGGIWSVSRGLARKVETYKKLLAECALKRRNDLDGRGNLSEEALAAFTKFFLEICLDQINFMEALVRPEKLQTRIRLWAEEEIALGTLPQKSGQILEAVLYRGLLPRGDAANIVGTGERQARRIVSALLERGVLSSESTRAPLSLAFPASLAGRWMPGLFPEAED
ncbi:MAG: cell filamentation protein Fic [Micavibrio sp.]|nr:cell filamentation protein Fic [Micavibrio sp.]